MALPFLIPAALVIAAKTANMVLQHRHAEEEEFELGVFNYYLVWFHMQHPVVVGDDMFIMHWGESCVPGDRKFRPARDYLGEVVGVEGKIVCVEVYGRPCDEHIGGLEICCKARPRIPLFYEKSGDIIVLMPGDKIDMKAARQLANEPEHIHNLSARVEGFDLAPHEFHTTAY